MRPDLRPFLVSILSGIYRPRTRLNAWQWGHKNIRLGSKESIDFEGAWDSSLTPYVRIVMEFVTGDFGDDVEFLPGYSAHDDWREMIIMKSSQLGFTLAYLIIIAYWIAEVRQNCAFCIDSEKEVGRISRGRLRPMLEACKATQAALEESTDEQSNLTLYLLTCMVYMMGSYGKGVWRNKSLSLCLQDELDAYLVTDELHPFNAASNRLKAVRGGKHIAGGAPETEEHMTAQLEKTGTQHRLFLPCPFCGHYQQLTWDQVRFNHCRDTTGEWDIERVRHDTYYECEFNLCHKRIDQDKHWPEMLRKRKWRQTNPKPHPRRMSIQLGDLCSLLSEAALGEIAVEFIQAQGNPALLKSWRKNRMGLPSKLESDQRTPDHIDKLRGFTPPGEIPPEPGEPYRHQYLRGTIPVEPCLVAVLSDVQSDVKKWTKVGFLPDGECYVIDWGYCLSFEELSLIAEDPVPIGIVPVKSSAERWVQSDGWDGPTTSATIGLIDEGFARLVVDVRAFCQRTVLGGDPCAFFPCKGRGGFQVRHSVQESETEALGQPLRVYHFSDDDFKKLLYLSRIARRVRPIKGIEPGPRLHMPSFLEPEFKGELCAERLTMVKEQGISREKWILPSGKANDWGDALKLAFILWHIMAPEYVDWKPLSEQDAVAEETAAEESA